MTLSYTARCSCGFKSTLKTDPTKEQGTATPLLEEAEDHVMKTKHTVQVEISHP